MRELSVCYDGNDGITMLVIVVVRYDIEGFHTVND